MKKHTAGLGRAMGSYSGGHVPIREVVKQVDAATCPRCGARLSVYRFPGDTVCAPCLTATRAV